MVSFASAQSSAPCSLLRSLDIGARGDDVSCLQRYLISQGLLSIDAASGFDGVTPTGFFGRLTKEAVRLFQTANGLEPIGGVGPRTRQLINAAGGATPTAPSTQASSSVSQGFVICLVTHGLAVGSRGDDVLCLQKILIAEGLLSADSNTGYFGTMTRTAVQEFQRARSIDPVGEVGPVTREAIRVAIESRAASNASGSGGASGVDLLTSASSQSQSSTTRVGPADTSSSEDYLSCSLDGITVPHGMSRMYYSVQTSDACSSYAGERVCNNGVLAGSIGHQYASCVVNGSPTAPTVTITSPTNGATVSLTTAVTASVTGTSVQGVQFKLDGTNLGVEDISSPYSVSWDTTASVNGSHSLTAVVRDSNSQTGTSATVTVTVANSSTYTVVRDGAIGDLASIQNTVNMAVSGDTVIIPTGQWVVNSTEGIRVATSGITIQGQSNSTTTGTRIVGLNGSSSHNMRGFVVEDANGVTIENLAILFSTSNNSVTTGILLKNTENVTIEDVAISTGPSGIKLDAGDNSSEGNSYTTIRNCRIFNGGYGIHIRHADHALIEGCNNYNNTDSVKFDLAYDATDNTFTRNYFHNNTRDAIDNAHIEGLTGVLARNIVEYNIFADNAESGVEWKNNNTEVSGLIYDNTFRRNLFLRNEDTGLILRKLRPVGAANATASASCPNPVYETEVDDNLIYGNGYSPSAGSSNPGGFLILNSCGITTNNNVIWNNDDAAASRDMTVGTPGSQSARILLNSNYFVDPATNYVLSGVSTQVDSNTNQALTPSGATYTQYESLKSTILSDIGSDVLNRTDPQSGQTIQQRIQLP